MFGIAHDNKAWKNIDSIALASTSYCLDFKVDNAFNRTTRSPYDSNVAVNMMSGAS